VSAPVTTLQRVDPAVIGTHKAEVELASNLALKHRITDAATRGGAAEIRARLKGIEKGIDASYDQHVKPTADLVRQAQAIRKTLTDTIAAGVKAIDSEILRDRREQEAAAERERKRIEAEAEEKRKALEEEQATRAREAAAKAEEEAKAAGMNAADQKAVGELYAQEEAAKPLPPVLVVAPPPAPARTIVSQTGFTASVKKLWDFELRDVGALAAAYPATVEVKRGAVLDLLRALERDGATEAALGNAIPGIRAFKSEKVSG